MSATLVAHADPALRAEIRRRLEADGRPVVEVADGPALRATLARQIPEALVVDVALPGALAIHLIPELRGDPATRDLVILLVASIYDSRAWRRPAKVLYGADAVVEPDRLDHTLVPRLRARLEARRPGPKGPR